MAKIAKYLIACPENDFHPPLLSYKAFLIYGLILLLLRILLGVIPTQGSAIDSGTLMQLINDERQRRNLPTLNNDTRLLVAAASKAQDMINRGYFGHIDPDGNYVWPRIEAAGYTPYKILGENLAIDFSTSEGMIRAWIDSPTHRENLLHPDFVDQGLSAIYGTFQGRYTNLTASLFGALVKIAPSTPKPLTPRAAPPVSKPKTAPGPAPQNPPASPKSAPETKLAPPSPAPSATSSSSALKPRAGESGLSGAPIHFPAVTTRQNPDRAGYLPAYALSRIIFTLFGVMLLIVLATDSVIVYKKELRVARSHVNYHFFGFMLIILITILIWWW